MGGQAVGVEARRLHQGEDGPGLDRSRSPSRCCFPGRRRRPSARMPAGSSGRHRLRHAAGDELLDAVDEQPRVVAGQDLVLRAFEAGRAVQRRVEAGGRCVQDPVGVVCRNLKVRFRATDRATGLVPTRMGPRSRSYPRAQALVFGLGVDLRRQDELRWNVRLTTSRIARMPEHPAEAAGSRGSSVDPHADHLGHGPVGAWAMTAGRRLRSLMRNSKAIIIQLQTSADPP